MEITTDNVVTVTLPIVKPTKPFIIIKKPDVKAIVNGDPNDFYILDDGD